MGLLQWDSVNLNQRRKNYMKLASYRFFSVHSGASYTRAMGWLRSVGSIKLYVSFAEYRLFYRALLQKRPVILSCTPTTCVVSHMGICISSQHIHSRPLTAGSPLVTPRPDTHWDWAIDSPLVTRVLLPPAAE